MRRLLLAIAVLALALPASARADTAKDLRKEVTRVADRAAAQWAGLLTPKNVFRNPWPADVAAGHSSFVPRGPRVRRPCRRPARARRRAGRAPPSAPGRTSVAPERASAFDMLAAAYAYRTLDLTPARKAQLGGYLGRYGIPLNGAVCITEPTLLQQPQAGRRRDRARHHRRRDPRRRSRPGGSPTRAPRAPPRRGSSTAACADVADFALRAFEAGALPPRHGPLRPAVGPDRLPRAIGVHARPRGPGARAGRLGRRPARPPRDARGARRCSSPPTASASYLGRGQDQVWVPAITAAALAAGARAFPARAPRYLGAARAALRRLERLHATRDRGFDVVPGASRRTTTAGIDPYVHTVAYNGLALFALTAARDALRRVPGRTRVAQARRPPGALALADPDATGLGDRRPTAARGWPSTRIRRNTSDLRHDLGLLALERRARPPLARPARRRARALRSPRRPPAPALLRDGIAIAPTGHELRVRRGRVALHRRLSPGPQAGPPRHAHLRAQAARRPPHPARGQARRRLPPARVHAGRHRPRPAARARRRRRPLALRPPGRRPPPAGLQLSSRWSSSTRSRRVVTVPRSGRFRLVHGSAVR